MWGRLVTCGPISNRPCTGFSDKLGLWLLLLQLRESQKSRIRERMIAGLIHFFGGFVSLPFDDRAAEAYGKIRADLERRGTPIGPNDLLIAAIALANSAILVTHNSREFSRVAGLKTEDWE